MNWIKVKFNRFKRAAKKTASRFDTDGSWTGNPKNPIDKPVQDADDL